MLVDRHLLDRLVLREWGIRETEDLRSWRHRLLNLGEEPPIGSEAFGVPVDGLHNSRFEPGERRLVEKANQEDAGPGGIANARGSTTRQGEEIAVDGPQGG